MHTDLGNRASKAYTLNIRCACSQQELAALLAPEEFAILWTSCFAQCSSQQLCIPQWGHKQVVTTGSCDIAGYCSLLLRTSSTELVLQGKCCDRFHACLRREQTMHWAIWQQMKSPAKGFEDIVRIHFFQRRKHVSTDPS